MGTERVLQAAGLRALPACVAGVLCLLAAAPRTDAAPTRDFGRSSGFGRGERVAVIDLGPDAHDDTTRKQLAAAILAAGFEPVLGDSVEDALAGQNVDRDGVELAAALAQAQRAFGALDCPAAITAATSATAIAAMRQAAGLPAPELVRAYTYLLLCHDKAGDVDGAMVAAARLRAVGGSGDVPAAVWSKYPEVDTIVDRDLVALEITTDVPGAEVWIDHARAGKTPLAVHLPAGEHLIAVAAGTRRGWAAGKTDPQQRKLEIPLRERGADGSQIATRVASWAGAAPSPAELGWVMGQVQARVVLLRRGDSVEAWGRIGRAEAPYRLGGDDGVATLAETDRLLALVTDRVQTWNDRAPDPDRPLLVERPGEGRRDRADPGTRWWVYASIIGAAVAAGAIVYFNETGSERQRVELEFPRVNP